MNQLSKLLRDIETLLLEDKYEEAHQASHKLIAEALKLENQINNLKEKHNG